MRPDLSPAEISRAIGLSRILLIVGLVFLHYGTFPNSLASPFQGIDLQEHRFATWANSAVLFFFFSAVPLLSMVSGWLFFSFPLEEGRTALHKRIRRRFFSLYMPLIVWNATYLAGLYALFMVNSHASPFTHMNRFNIDFTSAHWLDYGNAIFAVTGQPIAFQFWFVRDLFVTALVTPVFWRMLRHKPWAWAGALCFIWLMGWNLGIFIRSDVPFFFYMGALVRQKRVALTIPLPATLTLIVFYVLLACLRALSPYVVPVAAGGVEPFWLEVATRMMRVAGVLGCWGSIYRLARTGWGKRIGAYGGLAFFLHSVHWPLLAMVKIALWKFVPGDSDGWMLAHYVASVVTTVTIGLTLGLLLAKKWSKIFALMNGGRLLGEHSARAA